MKNKFFIGFFLVSLGLVLFVNKCNSNQTNQVEIIKNPEFKKFQIKLLEIHNKERTSRGYEPLVLDLKLCEYAQKHSDYMADKNRLVHSSMSDLKKVHEESSVVGENIAWGQETEESVVASWMWSPGHRWNILGSSYKRVGFGLKKDKNERNYWCVVFSN